MPLKGAKRHIARLRALSGPIVEREVSKALFAGGERIQVEAQILITTGAVSGKGHVPSRPGEPPNQDTGVLAGNIETTLKRPLVVEVSSNAPYAGIEFDFGNVAARPYMRPARDRKQGEVVALVNEAMNRVVKASRPTGGD